MFDETRSDAFEIAGALLLAHPHLRDPNFARSVVLMTAHEDAGSLGVVVNKPAGRNLGEVDRSFAKYGLEDVPLYIGGPVAQDQLLLSAWKVSPETNEFTLFFGLEPARAQEKRFLDPELNFRAFRGYAGWGRNQLAAELKDNAWVLSEMDGYALCRLEGDALWRHTVMNINLELGLMTMEPERPERN